MTYGTYLVVIVIYNATIDPPKKYIINYVHGNHTQILIIGCSFNRLHKSIYGKLNILIVSLEWLNDM